MHSLEEKEQHKAKTYKKIGYIKKKTKAKGKISHHSKILLIHVDGTQLGSSILLSSSHVIHPLYHGGDKSS